MFALRHKLYVMQNKAISINADREMRLIMNKTEIAKRYVLIDLDSKSIKKK